MNEVVWGENFIVVLLLMFIINNYDIIGVLFTGCRDWSMVLF